MSNHRITPYAVTQSHDAGIARLQTFIFIVTGVISISFSVVRKTQIYVIVRRLPVPLFGFNSTHNSHALI